MNSILNPDTILSLNPHCSVRAQEKQVVIYNSKTDELHLVPLPAFYIVQLCDGLNSVAKLEQYCSEASGSEILCLQPELGAFLSKLIERGVLSEVQSEPQAG
jgi:hypothetical protein